MAFVPAQSDSCVNNLIGSVNEWELSSTINGSGWWEIYTKKGTCHAVLFLTPYIGIILDSEKLERVHELLQRLSSIKDYFDTASKIELTPDQVLTIKLPTASRGITNSIIQLAHEALFLKKKVLGAEIIQAIIRTRSLVDRAARVHKDALPQIFHAAQADEKSKRKDVKDKPPIRSPKKKVSGGKPKVRSVFKSIKRVSSFKGKGKVSP